MPSKRLVFCTRREKPSSAKFEHSPACNMTTLFGNCIPVHAFNTTKANLGVTKKPIRCRYFTSWKDVFQEPLPHQSMPWSVAASKFDQNSLSPSTDDEDRFFDHEKEEFEDAFQDGKPVRMLNLWFWLYCSRGLSFMLSVEMDHEQIRNSHLETTNHWQGLI